MSAGWLRIARCFFSADNCSVANSFRLQANEDDSAVVGGLDSMADAIPESGRDQERDPRTPQHGSKNYEDG